jgi:tripartite ATP-independent transporter DctM subunit
MEISTDPRVLPAAAPRNLATRIADGLEGLVEFAAASLLVTTVCVALLQVFCRYVLSQALSWPEEFAKFTFVWFVMLGMAMVTRRGQHIAIDLVPRSLRGRNVLHHALFARVISAAAAGFLLVYGWQLTTRATFTSPALEWPHYYLYLAVPLGAVLTLILLALTPVAPARDEAAAVAAELAGERLETPSLGPLSGLASVIIGLAFAYGLNVLGESTFFDPSVAIAWPLAILVVGLMLIGVPIVDALIFGTCAAFLPRGPLMLVSVPQGMVNGLDYLLLAIPFFIVAAGFMNVGGITERLVALASSLVGHVRGGLGHVNVLTNTLMGGVSGSSTADAATIAKTMVPQMETRGYPKPFSVALTSAGSILANMIPPSLGLIVYASLASVSVGALFVATIVPGLLMALTLSLVVHIVCVVKGFGQTGTRATGEMRRKAFTAALPALVLPAIIVGGIRYGAFSATEAGAIAALYALICGVVIYRSANGRALVSALRSALTETVTVMVVIAASAPFAFALVIEQVPQKIAVTLATFSDNWIELLLVINLFLLFVGLAMEMIASMVILVPLLLPILKAANVDLVHFGIVMVANLCIGALTPPLAVLVFTAAKVTNTPIDATYRACRPFMLGLLIWLALITFIPALSLTAVRIFG